MSFLNELKFSFLIQLIPDVIVETDFHIYHAFLKKELHCNAVRERVMIMDAQFFAIKSLYF
jgi:hypothetical protein